MENEHPAETTPPDQVKRARKIGYRIARIAGAVPFKAVCLPQAMTGRWLLKRRHIRSQIVIGGRKGQGVRALDLHAWLMLDDSCITGHQEKDEFTAFQAKSNQVKADL